MNPIEAFNLLTWDSNFFGFKVATITAPFLNKEEIVDVCNKMKAESINLSYWKTSHEITEFPDQLDANLADIACIYSIELPLKTVKTDKHITLYRDQVVSDELESIAIQCGVHSRFKTDKRFAIGSYERMYKTWIEKSVNRLLADDIIIYKKEDKIAGIVTVYVKNNIGFIGLFGIDESMRGIGIGKHLLHAAINYFIDKKCERAQVITQNDNKAACSIYEKCGFLIKQKSYCYHIWM
jgi:ribosomal protein S18 acetylase RimI-like enzyme